MAKTGRMPIRSQVAHHATALAFLASFAACSHGSESRPRMSDEIGQQSAPAVGAASEPGTGSSSVANQGAVRSIEALATPGATAKGADTLTMRDAEAMNAPGARMNAAETSDNLPLAAAEEKLIPADPLRFAALERPRFTAAVDSSSSGIQPAASWPLLAGAGAAGVSLLALALLRRRDRKEAQKQRAADDLRTQQYVRAEVQRVHEKEQVQASASARAVEKMESDNASQAVTQAAATVGEQAAEPQQHQLPAELPPVDEHAGKHVDPTIEAAHRLLDLLHHAERDVEPFLCLLDTTVPKDASSAEARSVVASWHDSMLTTRNRLSEVLAEYNAVVDLRPVEPAADLQGAMSRLIDHAARMNALMMAQQQQDSAILHWSRLLPGALVQLFWRAQTVKYSSTMTQLPRVPDAPAPAPAPAPSNLPGPSSPSEHAAADVVRPTHTQDKAIQQALRGVQRHAAST